MGRGVWVPAQGRDDGVLKWRPSRDDDQSTLTLAALIIGHHFAISAFCQLPSACGESWSFGGICRPMFSSCLRTVGSFSASTVAAFNLATMSGGVPVGTHRPDHNVMWNPGRPASSVVGMSDADSARFVSVTA